MKSGDCYKHITGIEMFYLEKHSVKDIHPDAPNPEDEVYLFCWADATKHLQKMYFYGDQIEKWLTKVK